VGPTGRWRSLNDFTRSSLDSLHVGPYLVPSSPVFASLRWTDELTTAVLLLVRKQLAHHFLNGIMDWGVLVEGDFFLKSRQYTVVVDVRKQENGVQAVC